MFGFLPSHANCCSQAAACYRAHFCGLCNVLRQHHGLWARTLINRDSAFLSLLGHSLLPEPAPITRTTCCNPWATSRPLVQSSPMTPFVTSVTLCGLLAKLQDNLQDETGARRVFPAMALPLLSACEARATGCLQALGFPSHQVHHALGSSDEPAAPSDPFTAPAEATGEVYGEIVRFTGVLAGVPSSSFACLREIGRQLGLLIHLKDAWDDWESDHRRGRFNPLQRFPRLENRRQALFPVLQTSLEKLRRAFASLSLPRNRSLIGQVLINGCTMRVHEMLFTREEHERHKKERRERWRERWDQCTSSCQSCCDCCDCVDCCRHMHCTRPKAVPGKKGGLCQDHGPCDCNPCDSDGCHCCGCDCSP